MLAGPRERCSPDCDRCSQSTARRDVLGEEASQLRPPTPWLAVVSTRRSATLGTALFRA
jgi:hypothetical protein